MKTKGHDTSIDHPGRITSVHRVWCEWDVGNEGVVFTSEELARQWCESNEHLTEMWGPDQDFADIADIIDQGLLGFEELEVNPG